MSLRLLPLLSFFAASLPLASSAQTVSVPLRAPAAVGPAVLPIGPVLSPGLQAVGIPTLPLTAAPLPSGLPSLLPAPSPALAAARPASPAPAAAPRAAAAAALPQAGSLPAAAQAAPVAERSLKAVAEEFAELRRRDAPDSERLGVSAALFDSAARRPSAAAAESAAPSFSPMRRAGARLLRAAGLRRAAAFVEPPAPADPRVDAFVRELLFILVKSGGDPAKVEPELIDVLARAHAAGQLEPVLQAVVADPRVEPFLPPMPEEKRAGYASQLAFILGAELEGAGRIPGVKPFEPWEEMGRRHMGLVHASAYPSRGPAGTPLLEEEGFVKEFETLTGAVFTDGNKGRPLIDGPASFAVRFALMRRAKTSIHILSWAFYDDETGAAAADLLIEKKRAGVDVKVMVDGKTVRAHGAQTLERMRAAGVEVVFFQDPVRRYDGLHTKAMVVDGRYAVAGGMNFGNDYSHMGTGPKWRDTDMLYLGPAVARTSRFMRELWDAQVRTQGLPYGAMSEALGAAAGGVRMSFLAQEPAGEAVILLAYLKAIAAATRVINIENAYFITVPALREALLEALGRGVKVNILTNSPESVDEPVVIAPILESLPELIRAGASVSLKKGDTLHSKFMTVDGVFSILGSFNLHPRSVRYERELVLNVLGRRFASDLDRAFAADLAKARLVADPAEIVVPDSALVRIVRRYLFNQI